MQKALLKDDGIGVVIEILSMRFHRKRGNQLHTQKLITVSREVLLQYLMKKDRTLRSSRLFVGTDSNCFLRGQEGVQSAKELVNALSKALQEYRI
jgi:hypothetical protein